MTNVKRGHDLLTEEKRRQMINMIIDYFRDERGEDIGIIASGEILDFMLQNLTAEIYNRAVDDTIKLLRENIDSFEIDVNSILKK